MTTRSRIISGASALCGQLENIPIPQGVPMSTRYEVCCDLEIELLRDLNLSTENRAVGSFPVPLPPGSRNITITNPEMETPCFVQVQFNSSDIRWQDVQIVNLGSLEREYLAGHLAIAFYDNNPQQAMLSWEPSLSTGETLRVWFDRSPVEDPEMTGQTDIDFSYVGYLKLMLAAQLMELIGKAPGPVMSARLVRSEGQWQRFVKQSRQQGLAEKIPWRGMRSQRGRRGPWAADMIIR